MLRRTLSRFRSVSGVGDRRDRVSILVPFLIICAGLGVLAWRSYQLSIRMERGANTLAVQFAGYAAEITARRVDAAVRAELSRANDEWQQIERGSNTPDDEAVRQWINSNEWIVAAIYVPDRDPASSVYVAELAEASQKAQRLNREFFTSSGTVRYTFDPDRLLSRVHSAIRQQPLIRTAGMPGMLGLEQRADVSVVSSSARSGLTRLSNGFAFISPLASPLQAYAIRAAVPTSYAGSGWANQRLVSLLVSLLALTLMAIGAFLAMRGLSQEAETMKLRGALIANVSHELRTPLSMIRLGAETLKRGAKISAKERSDIEEQILREVLHLSHLVENVLDVARIQNQQARALAFTPVHPRDLVAMLVTSYESWIRSKGFTVSVDIDDDVEPQMWDRDAVSRALLNLIDNAIKYSGDDKRIDVCVSQTTKDVIIEVRDRGIGIDNRDLARIFDPYYRAKFSDTQTRRGAGLGLTLVQQIAASHGGRVEVDSQPGQGSTFRLLFPRTMSSEPARVPGLIQSKPLPS